MCLLYLCDVYFVLSMSFTISCFVAVSRIESGFRLAMFSVLSPFSILIVVFLSVASSGCFSVVSVFFFLLLLSFSSHLLSFSLFRVTFGSVFCVALFASYGVMLLFVRVLFWCPIVNVADVGTPPQRPTIPFPMPLSVCMFLVGLLRPGPPIIRGVLHCVIEILKLGLRCTLLLAHSWGSSLARRSSPPPPFLAQPGAIGLCFRQRRFHLGFGGLGVGGCCCSIVAFRVCFSLIGDVRHFPFVWSHCDFY